MTDLEEIALKEYCDMCACPPGEWCLTRTGKRATRLHAARTTPVHEAWVLGWTEGKKEQQKWVEDRFAEKFNGRRVFIGWEDVEIILNRTARLAI